MTLRCGTAIDDIRILGMKTTGLQTEGTIVKCQVRSLTETKKKRFLVRELHISWLRANFL